MIFRRDSTLEYSVRNKRKLTPFFAKELLFDFATNSLDQQRLLAMNRILSESPELRNELDNISYGIAYAEQLCQLLPSPELLNRMAFPPSYMGIVKDKVQFNRWPLTVRWFAEALLIGGAVSLVITLLPWHRVMTNAEKHLNEAVVIAELMKTPPIQEPAEDSPTPQPAQAPTITAATLKPEVKPIVKPPVTPAITPPVTPAKTVAVVPTVNPPTTVSKPKSPEELQGFLYRGTLTVSDIETTNQKIIEEIQTLGGKKAGGVPLGWAKENERYFHFTLPLSQLALLQAQLLNFGKLKISKERHERVMPEGTARLIISVYEEQKPAGL